MTSKVAVVLSGCGYLDGAEIQESVLTLLALDQAGVEVQCFAPDIEQQVVNHVTHEACHNETRNVFVESARIARGEILPVEQARADDFDALIFPGGFGAALNISNFAHSGKDATVHQATLAFARAMANQHKPLGFICIAPALIPLIYGETINLTIGNDVATANILKDMGANHIDCKVEEIIVDEQHKVVSTPAYMLGPNIAAVAQGISALVKKLLTMVEE